MFILPQPAHCQSGSLKKYGPKFKASSTEVAKYLVDEKKVRGKSIPLERADEFQRVQDYFDGFYISTRLVFGTGGIGISVVQPDDGSCVCADGGGLKYLFFYFI